MNMDEYLKLDRKALNVAIEAVVNEIRDGSEQGSTIAETGERVRIEAVEPGNPAWGLGQFFTEQFAHRASHFGVQAAITSMAGIAFRLGATYARALPSTRSADRE